MELALSVSPTNFQQVVLPLALLVPLVNILVLVLKPVMIAPQVARNAVALPHAPLVNRAMA